MNNLTKIVLPVAIFCSAGTALAQEINPSWYMQPSVVGVKPDRDFGVNEREYGGVMRAAIRNALQIGDQLRIVVNIAFVNTRVVRRIDAGITSECVNADP